MNSLLLECTEVVRAITYAFACTNCIEHLRLSYSDEGVTLAHVGVGKDVALFLQNGEDVRIVYMEDYFDFSE